jgi:hypothetical protein
MRAGSYSVGKSVSLVRSDGEPDGEATLLISDGLGSSHHAVVSTSTLVAALRAMGAFASAKKVPAPVTKEIAKDAVAVVDLWNETFDKTLSPERNRQFAERALLAGYTLSDLERVFLAIKSKATHTCAWLHGEGRKWLDFEHCTRPPYNHADGRLRKGMVYTILEELDNPCPEIHVRRTSTEEL